MLNINIYSLYKVTMSSTYSTYVEGSTLSDVEFEDCSSYSTYIIEGGKFMSDLSKLFADKELSEFRVMTGNDLKFEFFDPTSGCGSVLDIHFEEERESLTPQFVKDFIVDYKETAAF